LTAHREADQLLQLAGVIVNALTAIDKAAGGNQSIYASADSALAWRAAAEVLAQDFPYLLAAHNDRVIAEQDHDFGFTAGEFARWRGVVGGQARGCDLGFHS